LLNLLRLKLTVIVEKKADNAMKYAVNSSDLTVAFVVSYSKKMTFT
jgi:hypothetical protein